MADIALTAAQIGLVFAEGNETFDLIAVEAITKGQAVYITTAGKAGVADANAAGKEQFRGIALNAAAAGRAVTIVKRGFLYGFTVSSLNADVPLYLSDTAGALGDAVSATKTVNCGRVVCLTDKSATKVVHIEADWIRAW